ncbi:hypothetical protein [Oscillatoria sp. FACHB-1406]|uniref:hypothetical protein n=1 Tax=Oscillatoria sp. FACHB-1406 TaxID=2692846 RepID=UPI0016833532|nr:hypothetical protein [Oscillatoria sp. FACHB-1406]MBD2580033.1 hypothetical protein [Oscillatoria sp. FACHB-1406]
MNAQKSAREPIKSQEVTPEQPLTPNFSSIPGANNENFDFDVWAGAVRQQMLEVLHKRDDRRS